LKSAIDKISRLLAQETSSSSASSDAEIYAYALKILLLNISAAAGIIVVSWMLGTLPVTLVTWAAAFSLRVVAGGRHQPGPVTCLLTTVGIFTALGYLVTAVAPRMQEFIVPVSALGLVFTLYVIITYAPVTIASKQFSPAKRSKLKMTSVGVVVLWAAVVLAPAPATAGHQAAALGITAGLVTQAISLLPIRLPGSKLQAGRYSA